MNELESARKDWLRDRPEFSLFGKELKLRLEQSLKAEGIYGEVSTRAKETDSLIKKLVTKPKYTYRTLGDKCGVRVIVRYKSDLVRVYKLASQLFDCGPVDNKEEHLEHDQVGYLSSHIDLKLYKTDPDVQKWPPESFLAELQVRTLAQHLWSEMSHDTVYKSDDLLLSLPKELRRRVFLLAGAVEIADNEFDRLNKEMPNSPEAEILHALQRHYYKLTTRPFDVEMSLSAIKWLYPLYKSEAAKASAVIDDFWQESSDDLQRIYTDAETNENSRSAFLYQPEALIVFDLLRSKEWDIRQAWSEHDYPDKELERLAIAFGISLDA